MANEKKARDVARCVRTLVETQGYKLTLKEIIPLLEGEDLEQPITIAQKVTEAVRNRPTTTPTRSNAATTKVRRSDVIADWFVANYDVIHTCPEVEEGLLHLVSRGRVSKEEQERRRTALIARATGTETTDTPDTPTTTEEPTTTEFDF